MARIDSVAKFPFGRPEETGYLLFPAEFERDDLVFFHGTAEAKLESIVNDGFKIQGKLASVSFASTSQLPLSYACAARSSVSPNGCVIAVRYESLDRSGITHEGFGISDYTLDPQPTVIGYCIVPADYVYS